MNYHDLLYKLWSLLVKAFAISVGQVKTGKNGCPKAIPWVHGIGTFQIVKIFAERVRVMSRPHSTTGSTAILKQ